jgi:hypothetical protein
MVGCGAVASGVVRPQPLATNELTMSTSPITENLLLIILLGIDFPDIFPPSIISSVSPLSIYSSDWPSPANRGLPVS